MTPDPASTAPGKSRTGRVVITGATGFIGRALSRSLSQKGYRVLAVSRNAGRASEILGTEVESLSWSAEDDGWMDSVDGSLAVVNLAGENIGEGRWTRKKKERIRRSRLKAGEAVTEAVRRAKEKPAVVIQSSGVGIYGNTGDAILDETAPPGEGFLSRLAVEWEASTRDVESLGVRHATIRSGAVLGADGGAFPRMVLPFRFFVGGPLGNGKQGFSWIHLEDEIRAIRFLIDRNDLSGPFNLTAPPATTNRIFSRALAKALGRPALLRVPGFSLRLLFGEMAKELLLAGQMALPSRLLEAGFTFRYEDLATTLDDLLYGHGSQLSPPPGEPGDAHGLENAG
ncbi:MAG: TIGR01777 family oxidoreductase [Planctomycetota bacterium]